jgi:hypothetical protein
MATQTIVWTVLPNGLGRDGEPLVAVVPALRLVPQSDAEHQVDQFPDIRDWPATLAATGWRLETPSGSYALEPLALPDRTPWEQVFPPELYVAGFIFNDLSKHNLRSFPVRTLVSYLHRHYAQVAAHDGLERPSLYGPGSRLQAMLSELGIGLRQGGVRRWFADGDYKLPGGTRLTNELEEDYFSDRGYAPPTVTDIDGQPRANTTSYLSKLKVRRALPADLAGAAAGYFTSDPEYALYQANRFYQRPENERPYRRLPRAGAASAPLEPPTAEFHRFAAGFADAPALLRALGLVVDCRVVEGNDLVKLARNQPGGLLTGTMRLKVTHAHAWQIETLESCPSTAFRLTGGRFVCNTRTDRHTAGLLRLSGARAIGTQPAKPMLPVDHGFALTALDADGAALKTVGLALTFQDRLSKVANRLDPDTLSKPGEVTYSESQSETLAALRSGGIALVEHDRASHVADDTIAASLKNAALGAGQGDAIVLYAEDVLRGYRLDVRTERDGQWHSLCRRIAEYAWIGGDGPELPKAEDEGYLSGASTTSKPADGLPAGAARDHYLHETLAKWTGWSLVAPRPGRRIRAYPDSATPTGERAKLGLIQEERVDELGLEDAPKDGAPIVRRVRAAPRSLPRLRFGWEYRLRARLVDLAGNGLAYDDRGLGGLEEASEPIAYLRYEPLDPPVLALRARVSEGESLERMTIRSNFAVGTADYLGDKPYAVNVPEDSGFAYAAQNERHLIPPKTSQLMAEQHGLFETAFGSAATPADMAKEYETIAGLEAGTLYDGGPSVHLVTPPKDGANPRSPERPLDERPPEGFRLLPGEYLIHTEPSLATPYLPDPLAASAIFRGVPGVYKEIDLEDGVCIRRNPFRKEELLLIVPFAGDWPRVRGFRLAIVEHPDELGLNVCAPGAALPPLLPKWNREERLLTIFLRKGEVAPVRYSCAVGREYVEHLALPRLTGAPNNLALQARLGLNWTMTPDRTLVLVHATQQPVCEPVFERLVVSREAERTWAELRPAPVRYHARSTAKLEVLAEWMEWVDDPTQPAPVRRRLSAQLPEVPILAPALHSQEPFSGVELADLGQGTGETAYAHIRHEFGDHKFRLVRYRLRATTRFVEYLPASITANPDHLVRVGPAFAGHQLDLPAGYTQEYLYPNAPSGADALVLPPDAELGAPLLPRLASPLPGNPVPCSRRPDPPRVAYAVPTFRWEDREIAGGGLTSIRRGNGLRVYLERPWFSSGEGELLGVVVGSTVPGERAFADLPPALVGFVSQWGQDPILASDNPDTVMHASAFAARVATYSFPLPEAGRSLEIAAHRVHYDFERRLWYADLEIDAGKSYNPFVRLALVRVQPYAVVGCALSPVVHTQYAQLLPTRELHLSTAGDGSFGLRLFGTAPRIGSASARGELSGRHDLPVWIADTFGPALGYDRGRNRIELVVQQQHGLIATDLDWADVGTPVLDGELEPGQMTSGGVVRAATQGRALSPMSGASAPAIDPLLGEFALADLGLLRHDLLFEGRASVPPPPAGMRRRLMVREYERHFGDFDIKDRIGGQPVPRPGIVERLVFARELYVRGYRPGPIDD